MIGIANARDFNTTITFRFGERLFELESIHTVEQTDLWNISHTHLHHLPHLKFPEATFLSQ